MTSTLVTIASKGDLPMLERVLGGEFENFSEDDLSEALLRSSCHGYLKCVSKLLDFGADPDCEDLDGDTPLMLASANNHVAVVRLLVRKGCDIDLRSDRNRTALHMAVWSQKPRVVRLLLDAKCDVNVRDRYGDTPLMLCARRGGSDDIMKMLLDAGCDVNKANHEKERALHYACRYGHLDCVRQLLECSADVDAQTVWGLTPLMLAASSGCNKVAMELLGAEATVTFRDKSAKTALHHAVKHSMTTLVEWLLELGADPDAADADGNTPLFEALIAGHFKMVQLLVQYGCRVRDVIGHATFNGEYRWCTPLEGAVHLGKLSSARLLYAAGCDFSQFLGSAETAHVRNSAVAQWMSRTLAQPRSLEDISRVKIRSTLGYRLIHKLNTLPLPPTLSSYLSFADDEEFTEV